MSEPRIDNLDTFLLSLMEGQPPVRRRYELRCHPDVYLALRRASDDAQAKDWLPSVAAEAVSALYGGADVIVRAELGSGGWELYQDGELLKSGRLGEERP